MNDRLRPLVLSSALLAVGAVSPARAQGTAPAAAGKAGAPATTASPIPLAKALQGDAKSEYEAGRSLYGLGDRAGALVKFTRAYELSHDARLLWNMAACERDLHHYAKVIGLVERYLYEGGKSLTASEHAEAERILADARRLVSPLRVDVNEAGAIVEIDGEKVGTTPLAEPVLVDLGRRTIRITKPGFKDQVVTQDVPGASPITIAVKLVPAVHEGRLVVTTTKDAIVQIDGATVGRGPTWEGSLPSGRHLVTVTAPGRRPTTREVDLADDDQRTLSLPLSEGEGRLLVSTDPDGVIRVDGHAVGMGRWEGTVTAGSHVVTVRASGKEPHTTETVVSSGELRTLQITLKTPSSALSTVLWISGGAVVLAGLSVGGYFLFRPGERTEPPIVGSMTPGLVPMP